MKDAIAQIIDAIDLDIRLHWDNFVSDADRERWREAIEEVLAATGQAQ